MACIDFPASPTLGQQYVDPISGNTYECIAVGPPAQWEGLGGGGGGGTGGSAVYIGDTPPAVEDTFVGRLWWNSAAGQLFIYYNDGNTSQWTVCSTKDP